MQSASTHDHKEESRLTAQLKMATIKKILVKQSGSKKKKEKVKGMKIEEVIESVDEDTSALVGLRSKAVTVKDIQYVTNALENLVSQVKKVNEESSKQKINQSLRIFKLVLERLLEQFQTNPSLQSAAASAKIKCNEITKEIGSVPLLNEKVTLPPAQYLPPRYKSQTANKWAKVIWKNPGRTKKEKLDFLRREIKQEAKESKKASSVSQYLLTQAEGHQQVLKDDGSEDKFSVCGATLFVENIGNFRVDHLQPSSDIINRQKELLLAMNTDEDFGRAMVGSPYNQGYLLQGDDGFFYGTKKFAMEYYNDMENLWLISAAADNIGGKFDQDPIEWFRTNSYFGQNFLDSISPIDPTHIIYMTNQGKGLADAALAWINEKHSSLIKGELEMKTQDLIMRGVYKELDSWRQAEKNMEDKEKEKSAIVRRAAKVNTLMASALIGEVISQTKEEVEEGKKTISDESKESKEVESNDHQVTLEPRKEMKNVTQSSSSSSSSSSSFTQVSFFSQSSSSTTSSSLDEKDRLFLELSDDDSDDSVDSIHSSDGEQTEANLDLARKSVKRKAEEPKPLKKMMESATHSYLHKRHKLSQQDNNPQSDSLLQTGKSSSSSSSSSSEIDTSITGKKSSLNSS